MKSSLDLNPSFIDNINKIKPLENETFSFLINNRKVEMSLLKAILKSSRATKNLLQDNTERTLQINQNFRSNLIQNNVLDFLNSNDYVLNKKTERENEIFDLAEFGALIGNKSFFEPLKSYKQKQERERIQENNVMRKINVKDALSSFMNINESIDREIDYISSNFNLFYNKKDFIEWCKNDIQIERVEQIISSKKLHVNKEDDLFSFIANINKEGNKFICLLSHLHLEYCSMETCKQLIEMLKNGDVLKSRNIRNSVLECISKKLLHESISKDTKEEKRLSEFQSDICKATHKGILETVKILIERYGVAVETKDDDGCTLINIASKEGHINIVKYLHEVRHVNVETKDKDGKTPINNASSNGRLEVVKYLKEVCRANIEIKDNNESTSLNNASKYGHLEVVKYLKEKCHANVETSDNNGDTPINNASLNGRLEVVKYLKERCHANAETKDNDGFTPLNNASYWGNLEVVKYLCGLCHANLETNNNYGSTPINSASINGQFNVVKYLCETCHARITEKTIKNAKTEEIRNYLRRKI